MTALENLYERRSIRKYKPEQITDAELEQVLKAGVYAPTGMNQQSPIIVAVQNREDVAELSRLNGEVWGRGIDPFYGAPTVLVVLAAADSRFAVQDGSLVMGNLMNAAHAVGLGSCWINRAKEVFDMPEGKALLKKWAWRASIQASETAFSVMPPRSPRRKPARKITSITSDECIRF